MKGYRAFIGLLMMAVLVPVSGLTQERQRQPMDSGASTRAANPSIGATSGPIGSPGVLSGNTSSPAAMSPSVTGRYASPNQFVAPNLSGTSFPTLSTYYQWQDLFYYLRTRYYVSNWYFNRFYRNREPLITPPMMRLMIREPLQLSNRMVAAMHELERLVSEFRSGVAVSGDEIEARAQEIRKLATQIRKDNSFEYLDQRVNRDILKGKDYKQLGLGALDQLAEMVDSLDDQLHDLYGQNTTSTVSVEALSQPSFESLSKAIEKLSKVIEKSARTL